VFCLFRFRTRASLSICNRCSAPCRRVHVDRGTSTGDRYVNIVDRLRPSDEDIVKAFRQATEDPLPVETQEVTDEPAVAGPVPLPKRRQLPRP